MKFDSNARLMLIAPHPDDESLGCSVLLQRAVLTGASIRVVYATDGDDNPWPQRALERRWRINASDRKRWGKLRRAEALAALKVLGVDRRDVQFLALPDQGLTDLLQTNCFSIVRQFATIIDHWSPTHLLVPCRFDTHPDHNALAIIIRLSLAETSAREFSIWTYVVHGRSRAFFNQALTIVQSEKEAHKKLQAIRCHRTQLKLSRKRFLSYAERPESILNGRKNGTIQVDGAIREVTRSDSILRISIQLPPKLFRTGETALFVCGRDHEDVPRCIKIRVPVRSSAIEMLNCDSHLRIPARYEGNAFAGEFAIATAIFSPGTPLFVKLERRSLFFDEAGWMEVRPIIDRPRAAPAGPSVDFLLIR